MRFIDHKKLFFMRLPILMILYLKIISEMILHNDVESQCIKSLKCEINYIGKSLENIEFNLSGPKPIQINNLFYFTEDSIIEFSNSVKIFISDEENVKVYFRVADIYKNVTIKVTDGENVIYKKNKQKVAPGEMETVILKPEILSGIENGEIFVELEMRGDKWWI